MTQRRGLDYAHGRPDPAKIVAAGFTFVFRYLSTPSNPKNLTAAEARALHAAGIDIGLVFERTPTRPLGGAENGTQDGTLARQQAQAIGVPETTALYAAVDFDPAGKQMPLVLDYLTSFANAVEPYQAGVYGGYRTVEAARAAGIVNLRYLWQAGAWSGGKTHPAATLRQHVEAVTVDGVSCDTDTLLAPDFGGWLAKETPMTLVGLDQNDPVVKRIIASLTRVEDRQTQGLEQEGGHAADILAAVAGMSAGGLDPQVIEDAVKRGVLAAFREAGGG